MAKRFNVTGSCLPEYHYMVDISEKLKKIQMLVDSGEYFTINRASIWKNNNIKCAEAETRSRLLRLFDQL